MMKKVLTTMAIMAVSMMMCHRAVAQDLTKETPEEFFKFKYDKNKEFIKYATGEDAARAGWVYRNEGALRTIGQKKK